VPLFFCCLLPEEGTFHAAITGSELFVLDVLGKGVGGLWSVLLQAQASLLFLCLRR
jgi:hypothetical protein